MVTVQRIVVPNTKERSWVLFNAGGQPSVAPNQYLLYLHHLGRSPNTVRAYAHHLQAFSNFLSDHGEDWKTLSLTELAKFVVWLRRADSAGGKSRSDATINTILAAHPIVHTRPDRFDIPRQRQSVRSRVTAFSRLHASSPSVSSLIPVLRYLCSRRASGTAAPTVAAPPP